MYLLLFLNLLFSPVQDSVLLRSAENPSFLGAVSLTTDGKGKIYILDAVSNEIIKINESLKILGRVGRKGWDNGEFDAPTYIDGSSGLDIYVCDGKNYRLQRFDLNLSYISAIYTNTETYPPALQYQTPIASVFVNPYLYLIDGDNNRIVVYPQNGVPFQSFGGFQSAETPLIKPSKIIKDGYNNLYVLDMKKNSIFKFDNFGNYIRSVESDEIISISIFNNTLFILTPEFVYAFDVKLNAFTAKFYLAEKINRNFITDFLVYSPSKFYILERNRISEFKLK
jgi:hypothetical protein